MAQMASCHWLLVIALCSISECIGLRVICDNGVSSKSVVTCESQTAFLSCDQGTIKVLSANYGRTDRQTCSTGRPAYQLSNVQCTQSNSLSVVAVRCDGKTSCSIVAQNAAFGDPCFGTYKYLTVSYNCVAPQTPPPQTQPPQTQPPPPPPQTQPPPPPPQRQPPPPPPQRQPPPPPPQTQPPPPPPQTQPQPPPPPPQTQPPPPPPQTQPPPPPPQTQPPPPPPQRQPPPPPPQTQPPPPPPQTQPPPPPPQTQPPPPPPQTRVSSKSVVTCESQTAFLSCDQGTIKVISANYGRTDRQTCFTGSPAYQPLNILCTQSTSLSVLAIRCDGKMSCSIVAENAAFGDPCVGTCKYLTVSYNCVAPPPPQTQPRVTSKSIVTCESQNALLSCDQGTIKVLSANYGRTDRQTCFTGSPAYQPLNIQCTQSTSLNVVAIRCDGRMTCSFVAENAGFGDPCVGTYKYLTVSYNCVSAL